MSTIDIAMITYGPEDLIVALMPSNFDQVSTTDKNGLLHAIHSAAGSAKLRGRLIAVWEDEHGSQKTLSAPDLKPLCFLLSLRWVKRHLCARLEIA
ncbi:hypothetical protein [Rhizobium wenxiniae]|uniref:hypothetical protein n=1 Tax=Rhizobium wenxiniae TaxID=1737357 RepID=UPI003C1A4E3D